MTKVRSHKLIVWWTLFWLTGLLLTETLHVASHTQSNVMGDGAGVCAVCQLHDAPPPLSDTFSVEKAVGLPRSTPLFFANRETLAFFRYVLGNHSPRAPPRFLF